MQSKHNHGEGQGCWLVTDHRDDPAAAAFCTAEGYTPGDRVQFNGSLDYAERMGGEADAPGWQPLEGQRGEIVAVQLEAGDDGDGESGPRPYVHAAYMVLLDSGATVYACGEDFAR
jgi:hypothetical protein